MDYIEFSKVCESDVERLEEIENISFKIPWSKQAILNEIENELTIYMCVKINSKIIGYAGLWKIIDEGHITRIAIIPEHRRKGIGKQLLNELINEAKKYDIVSFTLEVRNSNIAALNLYKSLGFEVAGMRKSYYSDNNEDAIILWKRH